MSDDPRTLPEPERGIMPDHDAAIDRSAVEPETGVEPDPETAAKRAETWAPPEGEPATAPQ